ncbi:ABC transporter permease [Streptomyces chartreusis]|uniref:ABC transporter permease n=1 Tax=Streptomyces chartreusis TaxID=1969 RepID=UPI0035DFB227
MSVATASGVVPGVMRSPWVAFAMRRLWRILISFWVLLTATFLMIHLIPGDPVRSALGFNAPIEVVKSEQQALGLNDPLWLQYLHYVQNLFSGHLGVSIATKQSVSQIIGDRLPATLEVSILAFVLVMAIAIPIGVFMAVTTRGGQRRSRELAFTSTSVLLATIPEFLTAVALVYVFGVQLRWFPVAGRGDAGSYVLPVVSLAIGPAAVLARIVRVEMLTVLGNDFIRTARAKRLPARLVYGRHALPNALTATLTVGGMMLTGLIAGTVLVENVFAWPGLGSMIVQSILGKDYPVVQGIVLIYGVGVLLVNLIVDVSLAVLDPRSAIREN